MWTRLSFRRLCFDMRSSFLRHSIVTCSATPECAISRKMLAGLFCEETFIVADSAAGPFNTLANARIEMDAGRNIIGMKTPWFIGVPFAEYVRDVQRASQPLLPQQLRPAHEAGQFFLALEIAAKLRLRVLAELQSQISQRLPSTLLNDTLADWKHWPMRVKPVSAPERHFPTGFRLMFGIAGGDRQRILCESQLPSTFGDWRTIQVRTA